MKPKTDGAGSLREDLRGPGRGFADVPVAADVSPLPYPLHPKPSIVSSSETHARHPTPSCPELKNLQGYLAHRGGGQFLMSEEPLYSRNPKPETVGTSGR